MERRSAAVSVTKALYPRASFSKGILEMQNISAAWLYPIILIAGALQAWGPPMNNALRNSLQNPWLSSFVSFLPIVAFLFVVWVCQPHPLPSREGIAAMPWWAPLGGL